MPVRALIAASLVAGLLLTAQTAPAAAPDLVVRSVETGAQFLFPGRSVTVTVQIANAGVVAAPRSVTRIYLSKDRRLTRGDIRMDAWTTPALAPGAWSKRRKSVPVRGGTPGQTYYLLACADARTAIAEANERNNCRASARKYAIPIID